MKFNPIRTSFRSAPLALAAGLFLGTLAPAVQGATPYGRTWTQNEYRAAYRGVIAPEEGRYPSRAGSWIEVKVRNFTTEREARAIFDMYSTYGDRSVRRVLGNRDIGTLQLAEGVSQPLVAAWRMHDLSGEHLIVIVPRTAAVSDLFRAGDRSGRYDRYDDRNRDSRYDRDGRHDRNGRYDRADAPYAVLQLDLGGGDRYGSGQLYSATQLDLASEGGFNLDDLGRLPTRILHVEPIEP